MVIFAAVCFMAGLMTLSLPETKGHVLPESVEEGRRKIFGRVRDQHTISVVLIFNR